MSKQIEKSERELKELVLTYLSDYPDISVILFGSRATDTAGATSDFDIGLISKEIIPQKIIRELHDCVEESHIPYHVDFVDFSSVEPDFKKHALKGAIVWKD